MKRREVITLLGGAAAWPLAARAQQPERIRRIGYLNLGGSPESDSSRLTGLRRGLNQSGYVEGQNLLIEYRWRETKLTDYSVALANPCPRQLKAQQKKEPRCAKRGSKLRDAGHTVMRCAPCAGITTRLRTASL